MKRIIVLGTHRSGGSAVARAIGLLGASTGDPERLRDTGENMDLRVVNDALLAGSGGTWDAPPPGDDWLDDDNARGLVERAQQALVTAFGDAPISVWKDPRTSLTLPFWVELFDEEPVIVLVHRHPAEVAASLKLSNSIRPAHAYALWERYNAAALTVSRGFPTVVLDYGQVMSFPAEAATFLSRALSTWGVELPHDPATTDVQLSPQRRHHTAPDRDRVESPYATQSQIELFSLLDSVAGPHLPLLLAQPVPAASPVSEEILAMAASIRQLENERRELRQSEREVKRAAKRAGVDLTGLDPGGEPPAAEAEIVPVAAPDVAPVEVAAVAGVATAGPADGVGAAGADGGRSKNNKKRNRRRRNRRAAAGAGTGAGAAGVGAAGGEPVDAEYETTDAAGTDGMNPLGSSGPAFDPTDDAAPMAGPADDAAPVPEPADGAAGSGGVDDPLQYNDDHSSAPANQGEVADAPNGAADASSGSSAPGGGHVSLIELVNRARAETLAAEGRGDASNGTASPSAEPIGSSDRP